MLSITENIKELRKIINGNSFSDEEANEFLDAIEENAKELNKEIEDSEKRIKYKEEQVDDLEDEIERISVSGERIDCGIGEIKYEADNLLLGMVMENLDQAIQKHTPLKVNEHLSTLV